MLNPAYECRGGVAKSSSPSQAARAYSRITRSRAAHLCDARPRTPRLRVIRLHGAHPRAACPHSTRSHTARSRGTALPTDNVAQLFAPSPMYVEGTVPVACIKERTPMLTAAPVAILRGGAL